MDRRRDHKDVRDGTTEARVVTMQSVVAGTLNRSLLTEGCHDLQYAPCARAAGPAGLVTFIGTTRRHPRRYETTAARDTHSTIRAICAWVVRVDIGTVTCAQASSLRDLPTWSRTVGDGPRRPRCECRVQFQPSRRSCKAHDSIAHVGLRVATVDAGYDHCTRAAVVSTMHLDASGVALSNEKAQRHTDGSDRPRHRSVRVSSSEELDAHSAHQLRRSGLIRELLQSARN